MEPELGVQRRWPASPVLQDLARIDRSDGVTGPTNRDRHLFVADYETLEFGLDTADRLAG